MPFALYIFQPRTNSPGKKIEADLSAQTPRCHPHYYREAIMSTKKTSGRRKMTEEEIDNLVVAQAGRGKMGDVHLQISYICYLDQA
jgi:hypothetical protein